ncbi:MAG: polysaccharide pyruvyl transferase family protein [Myxococcota bacterium]
MHEIALAPDADAFGLLADGSTSLAGVLTESRRLREAGTRVRWRVPLRPGRVHRLEGIFALARDEGFEAILGEPDAALDPDERRFAWDFVRYRLLEEGAGRLPGAERERLLALERRLVAEPLPGDGRPFAADVAHVLVDAARGVLQWLAALPFRGGDAQKPVRNALLIGAYGGDHIGDAAILGGVLLRLHARHGTGQAVLLSQRPDHTRHLVAMLDVPVAVRVEGYRHEAIRRGLDEADAVVFAGGPLTEIPKQLVRHLYTAACARRRDMPFWIEGVGVGPFKRPPSEWIGRRLLRMAERIEVRTSDDAAQPQVRSLAPRVGRDPAFDYLASRGETLTRVPDADRAWLDHLLAGSEGRPLVALNVRPIDHLFTEGTPAAVDRAEHTRSVEERFLEELVRGMRLFSERAESAERANGPPRFVFYPMNAIQFGRSDLRSAWQIARRLAAGGGGVDFRVWQGDASIDGVVALPRRVDVAVAMRFHAAIYALSQDRPVVGIDYRPGAKDKVGYLLDDFGQGENCTRIDLLDGEWLAERLAALVVLPSGGEAS